MIKTTKTYVVRPAITADNPHTLAYKRISQAEQVAHLVSQQAIRLRHLLDMLLEQCYTLALCLDAAHVGLLRLQQTLRQFGTQPISIAFEQFGGKGLLPVKRDTHPQPKRGIILKQRVRPGRSSPLSIGRPWRRRQIPTIDGGAARRISNNHMIAKKLGYQLDIR